jgi:hypothetical protein
VRAEEHFLNGFEILKKKYEAFKKKHPHGKVRILDGPN